MGCRTLGEGGGRAGAGGGGKEGEGNPPVHGTGFSLVIYIVVISVCLSIFPSFRVSVEDT